MWLRALNRDTARQPTESDARWSLQSMSYRLALIPAVLFAALVLGDPESLDSAAQAASGLAETKAAESLAEAAKLLGAGKYKEARDLLAPLLKDDGKNRDARDQALYY